MKKQGSNRKKAIVNRSKEITDALSVLSLQMAWNRLQRANLPAAF